MVFYGLKQIKNLKIQKQLVKYSQDFEFILF